MGGTSANLLKTMIGPAKHLTLMGTTPNTHPLPSNLVDFVIYAIVLHFHPD